MIGLASLAGWAVLLAGAFLCVVNFYLSFLLYPLHRLRRGTRDNYKYASGIPLFGSLFVVVGWSLVLRQHKSMVVDTIALSLVAIDTGGIHWFIMVITYHWLRGRFSV